MDEEIAGQHIDVFTTRIRNTEIQKAEREGSIDVIWYYHDEQKSRSSYTSERNWKLAPAILQVSVSIWGKG